MFTSMSISKQYLDLEQIVTISLFRVVVVVVYQGSSLCRLKSASHRAGELLLQLVA